MSGRRDVAVWVLVGWLAVAAVSMFGYGLWGAWARDSDGDMRERLVEYTGFRVGVYPNAQLDQKIEGLPFRYSVYPPHAFPMFALFFEPGGEVQGRVMVQLLSLLALAVMGVFGRSTLVRHGAAWGAVGALAAAGIPAIKSVISIGQFSTICVGLVVLQIGFLERNRPLAAGACWAAAMIKPQIGLAFGALFLFNRHWRGLLFGMTILCVSSLFALWWTEVSTVKLVHHWLFRMSMTFAADSSGYGPAAFADWMGWNHRVVQYATLAAFVFAAVALIRLAMRDIWVHDLLPLAAICAALGRVLFYHRIYDQQMLFPLLLACLSVAISRPQRVSIAVAAAVAATLWIPQPFQELIPGHAFLQPAVWILAAIHVGLVLTSPHPEASPASA